ncbi:hypothetical protein [Nocardioides sp.]|uniref:hypothetical protein n=1 Tax=Nocardioides sp. TaxID=35761 RepID=UPI00262CBD1C|nr:hypothetical protein [Nocardioides sp.]
MIEATGLRRGSLGVLAMLTAVALSACGSGDGDMPAASSGTPLTASPSSTAAATDSATGSVTGSASAAVEVEPSISLSPAELAASKVYTPDYFKRLNLTGYLSGDDFVVGPLTEVIDLCGTTVAPASSPVAARRAVSSTGGGLGEKDPGQVTRSVAVYPTAAGATTTYEALRSGLAACAKAGSATITELDVPGTLAWRRTGYGSEEKWGSPNAGVAQVWTAWVHGRTVLVQYESQATALTTKRATATARTLLTSSVQVRSQIAEKIG